MKWIADRNILLKRDLFLHPFYMISALLLAALLSPIAIEFDRAFNCV